jgi:hypothetical protein
VSTPFAIEQLADPAFVTVKVTLPVPEPPPEVNWRGWPTTPLVEVSVRAACAMRGAVTNVTVVVGELIAEYVRSAALVAVSLHVPAFVASNLPLAIKQPAEPELLITYETAPVPEPPFVVSVRAVPTTPLVEVSVRAACAT